MFTPANFSTASLWQVLHNQLSVEKNSAVYVAFSGGLDSHVLLHALSALASDYPFSLKAIHIDHSLLYSCNHLPGQATVSRYAIACLCRLLSGRLA